MARTKESAQRYQTTFSTAILLAVVVGWERDYSVHTCTVLTCVCVRPVSCVHVYVCGLCLVYMCMCVACVLVTYLDALVVLVYVFTDPLILDHISDEQCQPHMHRVHFSGIQYVLTYMHLLCSGSSTVCRAMSENCLLLQLAKIASLFCPPYCITLCCNEHFTGRVLHSMA